MEGLHTKQEPLRGQWTEGFELGLLPRHEGMDWWRLLWLGHHDMELCPLPEAPLGAVLPPASELFLQCPCHSGL